MTGLNRKLRGTNYSLTVVDGMRACRSCGSVKALDEFPNNNKGIDGKAAKCRLCMSAYKAEQRRLNPPKRNRELDRQASERRRIQTANSDDITRAALLIRDGYLCAYCQCETTTASQGWTWIPNKATVDHVIPLSKGGTHTWDNVVIACAQCNVTKGAKEGWQ